jgi:ADP-ribose pyrophosphatase YjhB (NUDIX family)
MKNRDLLVQEKQEKVYGKWNIPAGYVDKDEEVEHAAIREVKEESGYDVELDGLIGIYHDTTKEPVKQVYKAHIVGDDLKIQEDEILNAKWL